MKTRTHADTKIRVIISITELFIRFICIQKIIRITGIHIAIQEFIKNLHLLTACLNIPLIVSHKFEDTNPMLFITASHAE